MATLKIDNEELVIGLSPRERLGALRGGLCAPLSAIRAIRHTEDLWRERKGWRRGTGIPGAILLGTTRYKGGRDFVAIYGKKPGYVIEFADDFEFSRALISSDIDNFDNTVASARLEY